MAETTHRDTDTLSPRAAHWQAVIADWAQSGQSQRAYCQRKRIPAGTFAWWKHQLASAARTRRPPRSRTTRFVEVTVRPTHRDDRVPSDRPPRSVPLELLLPGGLRVRIGADCDGALLGRVLAVLREMPC